MSTATGSRAPDNVGEMPGELGGRHLRSRIALIVVLAAVVVGVITLVPGLAGLRTRLSHAQPGWLALGALLKALSGLSYVAIFRSIFCRRMTWNMSLRIGFSELGANALVPTGGAGGLALGAWALRRTGMASDRIARRTVAFFLLTSLANVAALILVGLGLATGLLPGHVSLALSLVPVGAAVAAIVAALGAGRLSARLDVRLRASGRRNRSRAARVMSGALRAVHDGVAESLGLLRERDPWLLAGSAGYLLFDIAILWATFRAFGSSPGIPIVLIAYLIGELGGLIPIPGGLGGVDLGLVGTLVLYGVSGGAATAAVLGYRAIVLVVPAVLGAIAFVALHRALASERDLQISC